VPSIESPVPGVPCHELRKRDRFETKKSRQNLLQVDSHASVQQAVCIGIKLVNIMIHMSCDKWRSVQFVQMTHILLIYVHHVKMDGILHNVKRHSFAQCEKICILMLCADVALFARN
jgi:hypothetical protein